MRTVLSRKPARARKMFAREGRQEDCVQKEKEDTNCSGSVLHDGLTARAEE